MKNVTNNSVFSFSSPEFLMRQSWRLLLINLINNGVLKMVRVDETHLFVMFRVTFRKSFSNLKEFFSII